MVDAKLVKDVARQFQLDPLLLTAMIIVESSSKSQVARYEPDYRYTHNPAKFAKPQGITIETEKRLQMFSWGCLQLMGGTARWLGYNGFLPQLCEPQIGLYWGSRYMRHLMDKYSEPEDAIAAYNAGSPRKKENGHYENQEYVNKVIRTYKQLNGGSNA